MNEASTKIKLQVVDKIKSATNILVTVSSSPSIDELSAALGLTVMLDKIDKHATAIFSGNIPSVIAFLNPDKVFEDTADSLRDFIISLDKEKADHLRYKIDGDFVKIYITPYKTTIDENDLEFNQGDYNIDLVLALGVDNQEHLDVALAANGRQILDDVTIITLSAGSQSSQLGSLDWRDENVGCLSEMIASLGDALKTTKPLIDKQISTALLTGIVAATDRFSNEHTSSQVMNTAAQLMAAGADQQLIAAKLQESHDISALPSNVVPMKDNASQAQDIPLVETTVPANNDNGSLNISHDEATEKAEEELSSTLPPEPEPTPELAQVPEPMPTPEPEPEQPKIEQKEVPTIQEVISHEDGGANLDTEAEPTFGGTLNATADQAADDARRELEDQQNKTTLSHSYLSGSSNIEDTAINGSTLPPEDTKMVDPLSEGSTNSETSTLPPEEKITIPEPVMPTPSVDLPLPPPLPDFSTLPPSPSTLQPAAAQVEPQPDNTLPTSTLPPSADDPSKFKIPGQ